jgi:hypothetical protein
MAYIDRLTEIDRHGVEHSPDFTIEDPISDEDALAALDALDDFDSDEFDLPTRRAGSDYLGSMWSGYGFDPAARTDSVLIAHGMINSLVNAFARGGARYDVVFDPTMPTAATDMERRRVAVTPSPLLDPSLTPQQAGEILSALAVHEICHPRYGKDTYKAVVAVFKNNPVAHTLSNTLDDVRIERRFVEDYPGYSGIFDPLMRYITDGIVKKNGTKMRPRIDKLADVANAAIRWTDAVDWAGWEDERDWWQDWAERSAVHDSPRRHVEAIREGMRHIVARKLAEEARREEERKQREAEEAAASVAREKVQAEAADDEAEEPDEDDDEPDYAGDSGTSPESDDEDEESDDLNEDDAPAGGGGKAPDPEEDDEPIDADGLGSDLGDEDEFRQDVGHDDLDDDEQEPADDAADESDTGDDDADDDADAAEAEADVMSDEDLASRLTRSDAATDTPTCAGSSAVDDAAREAGIDDQDIEEMREEAQTAVSEAQFYEDDGHGRRVEVLRSMKGLIHGRLDYRSSRLFKKSDLASRFIRDALMQSRSGHSETSHYQKRGRLDQHALHRIASHDFRLFDRKRAQSPGRYVVWMLLDRSSSMDGHPSIQQAQVATAIADATRHVKTVRAAVWAWSDSFRRPDGAYYGYGPGVVLAWRTGQPTDDIARTIDLPSGGTPDAAVLGWATDAILREARLGEQPVILLCSDGWGDSGLGQRVEEARKKGILVASVAFGNLDAASQEERFGRDGFVPWAGSIVQTARPLAKLVARIVGHDRRG